MFLKPGQFTLLATAVTALVTLGLLIRRGLRQAYPALFWLLLAEGVQDLILIGAYPSPYYYFRLWTATQLTGLVLQIWVMRELLGILVERFENIRKLTDRLIGWFFLLALIVASVVAFLAHSAQLQGGDLSSGTYRRTWALAYVSLTILIVEVFVVVFLICAAAYFLYFPVQLSRNAVVYYLTFVALDLTYLGGILFMQSTTMQKHREGFNLLFFASSICAYLLLAFSLRRASEDTLVQPRHADPATQRRLLEQLQQIDNLLAHTATRLEL